MSTKRRYVSNVDRSSWGPVRISDAGQGKSWMWLMLLLPISVILRGSLLVVLWDWFVVPAFHLAPLAIPVAMGLALIVDLFASTKMELAPKKAEEDVEVLPFEQLFRRALFSIAWPPVVIYTMAIFFHLFV